MTIRVRTLLGPIAAIFCATILLGIGLLLGVTGAMGFILELAAIAAIGLPLLRWAGRRYEQRELANGEWDAAGPKHPTPTPRNFRPRVQSNGLAFDLEHGLDRDSDWPGGVRPRRPADDAPLT